VHYSRGIWLKRSGEYQKAIEQFMKAAEHKTSMENVYFQLADCHYALFDYENSLKYANLAIGENPDNSKPYLLIYTMYSNLQKFPEAADALESFLKRRPEMAGVWHMLGVLYYSSLKDAQRARRSFLSVLDAAETAPVDDYYLEYAHFYLGHIYYAQGQPELAASHFKKTLAVNPDNTSATYAIAIVYMYRYMIADAEKYARSYLQRFPENVIINSVMGRIYYLQGKMDALPYLRRAAGDASEEARLSRALYLELLRRDDEAQEALHEFLKKSTAYITPHLALARVSMRKQNTIIGLREYFTAGVLLSKNRLFAQARESLISALSINEKIPELYLYLANACEESGDLNQAIVNYRKAYELRPDSDLLLTIGFLYSLKKDQEQSERNIKLVIDKEPSNPKPYFFRGLIATRSENYRDAERSFRKAIELNDRNDNYHFYLAVALEKLNRPDETITALKRAVEINPANSRASNFLGYLYAEKGSNLDESIALIQKALEYEPENGAYLDSLGWAYFRKGEVKLALRKLLEAERALAEDKNPDPVVYDHLGDACRSLGETQRAVEFWQRSLKIKPDEKIERKIREAQSAVK